MEIGINLYLQWLYGSVIEYFAEMVEKAGKSPD